PTACCNGREAPGKPVPASLPARQDHGNLASFLSVCVGGEGEESRLSGTIRAGGARPQLCCSSSQLREESQSGATASGGIRTKDTFAQWGQSGCGGARTTRTRGGARRQRRGKRTH